MTWLEAGRVHARHPGNRIRRSSDHTLRRTRAVEGNGDVTKPTAARDDAVAEPGQALRRIAATRIRGRRHDATGVTVHLATDPGSAVAACDGDVAETARGQDVALAEAR